MISAIAMDKLRALLSKLPEPEFEKIAKARMLDHFEKTHAFCGYCGAHMIYAADTEIKYAKRCSNPNCKGYLNFSYPSYSIAIISLIENAEGDKILLGHNKLWPEGRISLLAGFLQPGESLERCLRREVKEESGLELSSIRYITSQTWPFPSNLMAGFYAKSKKGQLARPDGKELDKLFWLSRKEIKELIKYNKPMPALSLPMPGSLARFLCDMWLKA